MDQNEGFIGKLYNFTKISLRYSLPLGQNYAPHCINLLCYYSVLNLIPFNVVLVISNYNVTRSKQIQAEKFAKVQGLDCIHKQSFLLLLFPLLFLNSKTKNAKGLKVNISE